MINIPYIYDLKNRISSDDFIQTIACSVPIILLIGYNSFFNVVLVLYTLFISLKLNSKVLFYVYIFMSFFEEVTIVNFLGGSISRIIMIVLIFKLASSIYRNKYEINMKLLAILLYFILSCVMGWIFNRVNFADISILLNVIVILLYGDYIYHYKQDERVSIIKVLKKIIVYGVFIAILYGFAHFAFIQEVTANLTNLRFKGTYEPNFMSLFINIGLSILLFDKDNIFQFKERFLLMIFFVIALWMTVSITGILVFVAVLLYYLYVKNKCYIRKTIINYKKIIILIALLLVSTGIAGFTYLEVISRSQHEPITEKETNNRFLFLYETLKKGDLNTFTSGRISLMEDFYRASIDRNVFEMALGNGPSTKVVYSNFFQKDKFAHNTYLDFLYSFGIVGFIVNMIYIIKVLQRNTFLGIKLDHNDSITILRYVYITFGMALSLYSKRVVFLFFLI
ncbi:hypothetical protein L0P73_19360 [[Clostridium] innocuum]|uniref:O-antigen ligase family protein n=1 Tax=Clostridium innocuum TaxID=1522 RepID=UPI001EDF5573|nr:O-antigen ligase family protein [[Clostridium] innocuum]MCG4662735.1 hypothetical protein [[Clostridium] innocuum]MCR0332744.1 hypothetical protein [[Clostridium] innocuum]